MKRFDRDRVEIAFEEQREAVWRFQSRVVRGEEFFYEVIDGNFASRNRWMFRIRVPNSLRGQTYMGVAPSRVPNRRRWAGLDRRSLQFRRGTIGKHRSRVYANLAISDFKGEKNRIVLSSRDRPGLPSWLLPFRPLVRHRVIRTRFDQDQTLVVSLKSDDHAGFIKLFLAVKPWILSAEFDRSVGKPRRKRLSPSIKGMRVAVSGRLQNGPRARFFARLRRAGGIPKTTVTRDTNALIVGAHYLGEDRRKLLRAESLNIRRMSEAAFRRRFGL